MHSSKNDYILFHASGDAAIHQHDMDIGFTANPQKSLCEGFAITSSAGTSATAAVSVPSAADAEAAEVENTAAAPAPMEENGNGAQNTPPDGADAGNLVIDEHGDEGGHEGGDKGGNGDEALHHQNSLGRFKCVSCEHRFKKARYLATHVSNRKCSPAKRQGWQCTRCGMSGDDEWLSQHDSIKHKEEWLSKYQRV